MFAQTNRLTKTKDIDKVFKSGQTAFGASLGLKVLSNDRGYLRATVIVGVKVSKKAVERNLLKRRLRAVLRELLDIKHCSYDLVVIVKPASQNAEFEKLRAEIARLLKRLKLL